MKFEECAKRPVFAQRVTYRLLNCFVDLKRNHSIQCYNDIALNCIANYSNRTFTPSTCCCQTFSAGHCKVLIIKII